MMFDENEAIQTVTFAERRVHPAGMIFNFIKAIKDSILGLGAGTIAFIQSSFFWALIFVGAIVLLLMILSVLSWLRFTYRVEAGELRIEQGIFIRKKRYIPLHRIHKIDFSANVVHRIFKLVKVNVDTAAGGGADADLSAVKLVDANQLRDSLKTVEVATELEDDIIEKNPQKKISLKHLIFAGVTSGRAGFILLAGLAVFSQLVQYIPDSFYQQSYQVILKIGLVLAIVIFILAMILLWVIGAVGTIIKFGNFTIEKREKELFIKRGLLETKEFTLPFDRIQAVEIEQSLLRQPFKLAKITAISAGGVVDKYESAPVVFPLMPIKEIEGFLQEFLPSHSNIQQTLVPLPKKARKYFWFKSLWFLTLVTGGILYFFPKFALIPFALLLLSWAYGHLAYKDSGYALDGSKLIMQNRRAFSKVISMTDRRRIQALEKRQNKFEQMEKLGTPTISVIRLNNRIKHLSEEDADMIADWYSRKFKKTDGYIYQ